jgi:hypothetical protein
LIGGDLTSFVKSACWVFVGPRGRQLFQLCRQLELTPKTKKFFGFGFGFGFWVDV